MLDFTSALYLDMHHASWSLRPWGRLTTGRPTALSALPRSHRVSQALAALQGCECATLAPSTLHLFWDLFGILAKERVAIYLDEGAYPIARWGVERASARGVPVRSFSHYDAEALKRKIERDAPHGWFPLVVADGFCPSCGRSAPIAGYLKIVRSFGGRVILDDTQALGILGEPSGPEAPYGRGGGGSLRRSNLGGPDVLLISSLAKGFGVPMAVLSGSNDTVRRFEESSETRVHASPPSNAVIHAAEHALAINRERGDALRLRLAQLVRRFRHRLNQAGFAARGGLFPVQTLVPLTGLDSVTVHRRLLQEGVRTVLHHSRNGARNGARNGSRAHISFLITAGHSPEKIDRSVDVLAQVKAIRRKLGVGYE